MTALVALLALSVNQGRIDVNLNRPGAKVPKGLYGVFLEEINNSGEGGLYAELIQNRGFEDASAPQGCPIVGRELHAPKNPSFWEGRSKDFRMEWPYAGNATPGWRLEGVGVSVALTADRPLSKASPHAVRLSVDKPGGSLVNEGFWGMNFVKGEKVRLSLFLLNESFAGAFEARLLGEDGTLLGSRRFTVPSSKAWSKVNLDITATGSDPKGRFALAPLGRGDVLVDFVSLFPARTFKNRPNGLRPDLAQMIADLKPGFIRWPGGCVVEGITVETRPRWEQTLGPLEDRVPTFIPWGYWVSNGFGYHEWLQFCEDIGAEPLYVFNVGVSCAFRSGTFLPDEDLPGLIQDTLDAIEYAIGPPTSKWGALRAKAGHPKPFNMRVVEIGNEQQGPRYGARVKLFTEAIKAKYPHLKVALSSWISGIDQPAIDAAGSQLDIVDEHAYRPVNWAVQNFDSFAKYSRDVPWKVYIGEFATNSGVGRGNMLATVGDAAYMMSMEKNADLVTMGSYAPLLENTNRRQWEVNLIHFDSSRAYGRASYYACKMFAENLPEVGLETKVDFRASGESPIRGPIGLGSYLTQAEFKDIRLEQNGVTRDLNNFSAWKPRSGKWEVRDNVYAQTDLGFDCWTYFGDGFQDVTVTLKARSVKGAEGFVVSAGNADGRRVHFNVGGWQNRQHGLEVAGPIRQVNGGVEQGRWYDVKLQTIGRRVLCFLDGRLIFDESLPRVDRVLSVAGKDSNGDVIVKVLNASDQPADLDVAISGGSFARAIVTELSADQPTAENSYEAPRRIFPRESISTVRQNRVTRTFPSYSVTILRFKSR
ncbi:MAG TPA: alpha-L-arabinofuranosidase C-terminal domain-containing protein [Fimbriimonadaceae bacterium]|nr:alpha-L-arabinofuranosidase C-terminal domain-containing protein [Fimbriimonadaceae bacterium]